MCSREWYNLVKVSRFKPCQFLISEFYICGIVISRPYIYIYIENLYISLKKKEKRSQDTVGFVRESNFRSHLIPWNLFLILCDILAKICSVFFFYIYIYFKLKIYGIIYGINTCTFLNIFN